MAEPIITLLENWDETHTLTRDEAIAILELPDEAAATADCRRLTCSGRNIKGKR